MLGGGLWTVARQTFTQCLRTRVVGVFTVLLVASLALLPSLMEGDGTLAGRIRTFLDYSTAAVKLLLSLTVVLLSAGLISGDVAGKHVMVLFAKPLAKWKYVLGRWLGVVLLAGVLLAGSYLAIYLTARYLRGLALAPARLDSAQSVEDARAVEMEVFAARTRTEAEPPDVEALVLAEIGRQQKQGEWANSVQTYMDTYQLDQTAAIRKLEDRLRRDALSKAQSVGPGGKLVWRFEDLPYGGEVYQGPGLVARVDPKQRVVMFRTSRDMARRLVIGGPVWILSGDVRAGGAPTGSEGKVVRLSNEFFLAEFPERTMESRFASAQPGAEVRVIVHPTLQFSYKIAAAADPNQGLCRVGWVFRNPDPNRPYLYEVPEQEVTIRNKHTIIVPAAVIGRHGGMIAEVTNLSPGTVTLLASDASVLYGLGGFQMNFVRSGLLALLGLMYLSAVGVLASSRLAFPVACLACLAALLIGAGQEFLTGAIELGPGRGATAVSQTLFGLADWMLRGLKLLLPDLPASMGGRALVDGMRISWGFVGEVALLTMGVRGLLLLGAGCVLFHRRELAQVQV